MCKSGKVDDDLFCTKILCTFTRIWILIRVKATGMFEHTDTLHALVWPSD